MLQNHMPVDVFISHKSADLPLAQQLCHFLKDKGLTVFESNETLPRMGNADYREAIDKALDQCKHLIVVGSSVENIAAPWVKKEWGSYINEKLSGRKEGNILTVVTPDIKIDELPIGLRSYEVIYFKKENFDRIAAYVGKDYQDIKYKPPKKNPLQSKWILPVISVLCLVGVFGYIIAEKNKPFDATFFLGPESSLHLNAGYPAFEGGELIVYLGNKEEKKAVLPNQEIVLKKIPAGYSQAKVAVRLKAGNWKLAADSVMLAETVNLDIVPDGSLATIQGNVRNSIGNIVEGCKIGIDTDTVVYSNREGVFKIRLPYSMQKKQYLLTISKEGFETQKLDYFSGSGNIDVLLRN